MTCVGSKIAGSFGVVILLLVMIGILSDSNIRVLQTNTAWVIHTHQVIETLEDTLSQLENAETGQRGFVITGNASYLAPYTSARKLIPRRLRQLRELTRDNPAQVHRVDQLTPLVNRKLAELQQVIALRRGPGGFAAARALVVTNAGTKTMDQLRLLVAAMEAEEQRLLMVRTHNANASARGMREVVIIGVPMTVIILILLGIALTRDIAVPLTKMTAIAERIAQGDLVGAIASTRRRDEVGRLQVSFQRMTRWLRKMADTAREITEGNLDVSVIPQSAADEFGHAFVRMISTLRALTADLREREAQLTAIVENLSEGVVVSTVEGDLLQWNRAALDMHGLANLEEARRRLPEFSSYFELHTLDGAFIPLDQWPMSRVLDGETLRDWDVRLVLLKTGLERIFSYNGALVFAPDGHPLMAVLSVTDVSERRRAEEQLRQLNATLEERVQERTAAFETSNEALRRSEERSRLMIESVKDYAIILLDTHGLVTSWNVGAERIKGYRADEILGRSFSVFYTPEDIAVGNPLHELEQALASGRFENEGWRVRKDGSRFWASVIMTPLYTAEGVHFGFVKITRDISERRRADEELLRLNSDLQRRSVALEVAFKEMETFSYSVAHDLRSPLRSLDGFSRYLLDHYADRLDAQGVDYLQRMRAAAQRMARLIDDLLNLARVGRTEMRIEPVNLSRMVSDIIDGLRRRDPERTAHVEIAPEVIVQGDYGLLRIALEHLLDNAWKFTGTRTETRIIFAARERQGAWVYSVRDNGVGFDMSYSDKLFQPFQRLHTEEEFPGTGIGLALAQRIIQRHGGRIWAEAVIGQEATFYFTLQEDSQ